MLMNGAPYLSGDFAVRHRGKPLKHRDEFSHHYRSAPAIHPCSGPGTTRLGEPCLHDFVAFAPKMGPQDIGKPAGVAPLQRIQRHLVFAYRFSPNASFNGPANKRKISTSTILMCYQSRDFREGMEAGRKSWAL
jgi:hypothetical protein